MPVAVCGVSRRESPWITYAALQGEFRIPNLSVFFEPLHRQICLQIVQFRVGEVAYKAIGARYAHSSVTTYIDFTVYAIKCASWLFSTWFVTGGIGPDHREGMPSVSACD